MKRVVKMAKAFNVETPVLNVMFLSYFVLLVVTASFIVKHSNSENQASAVTATTATEGNTQTN